MNQKEKDILKANPVLTKPDFAEQLRQWEKKEQGKSNEQLSNKSKRHSNVGKQDNSSKTKTSKMDNN
jgi:hypothetical protein